MNKKDGVKSSVIIIGLIIAMILFLLAIQSVLATPSIDWISPNQNGEIIDEYPQNIRFVARNSEDTITSCNVTVGDLEYDTYIGESIVEVNIEAKLEEGTHQITINCTNTTDSVQESKNVSINDVINITKQNDEDKKIILYFAVMIILIIIFAISKQNIEKLLISTIALFASIIIYYQTKEIIMSIPLVLCVVITVRELVKTLIRK